MASNEYHYRVIWSPEDAEHVGLCSEFPSLSWLAPAPEAALTGIRKLIHEAAGKCNPRKRQSHNLDSSAVVGGPNQCRFVKEKLPSEAKAQ